MSETFETNLNQLMDNLSIKKNGYRRKPLEFSDLTTDVIEVIIEKSEFKEQLTLRKVCKSLRSLVDKQKPACRSIYINCYLDFISCRFNHFTAVYAKPEWSLKENEYKVGCYGTVVATNKDYEKMAFDDLARLFKNPKLQLGIFCFECRLAWRSSLTRSEEEHLVKRCYKNLENVLESLKHRVSLNILDIRADTPNNLLSILPYLKPGVLEEIKINGADSQGSWRDPSALNVFERISSTEQWKQAQIIGLRYALDKIPWRHLNHFKEFWIYEFRVNSMELVELRDIFAKLPNFKLCQIDTKDGFNSEMCASRIDESQIPVKLNGRIFFDPDYVVNYSIPGTEDYLEFKIFRTREAITIDKKHR